MDNNVNNLLKMFETYNNIRNNYIGLINIKFEKLMLDKCSKSKINAINKTEFIVEKPEIIGGDGFEDLYNRIWYIFADSTENYYYKKLYEFNNKKVPNYVLNHIESTQMAISRISFIISNGIKYRRTFKDILSKIHIVISKHLQKWIIDSCAGNSFSKNKIMKNIFYNDSKIYFNSMQEYFEYLNSMKLYSVSYENDHFKLTNDKHYQIFTLIKSCNSPMYHGTSINAARKILNCGYMMGRIDDIKHDNFNKVFFTTSLEYAKLMGAMGGASLVYPANDLFIIFEINLDKYDVYLYYEKNNKYTSTKEEYVVWGKVQVDDNSKIYLVKKDEFKVETSKEKLLEWLEKFNYITDQQNPLNYYS